MSTITVRQDHSLSTEEARSRIDTFGESIAKWGAHLEWNGNNAEVKGFGVSGKAEVAEDFVTITITLGMMAKAAGVDPVRVEGSIKKRLAAVFEDTATA